MMSCTIDRNIEFQRFAQGKLHQEERPDEALPDEACPERNVEIQYSCIPFLSTNHVIVYSILRRICNNLFTKSA